MSGGQPRPPAELLVEQRDAADPASNVWLNASAGTGKTQVLSARVLRLLLDGVRPQAILCITFTKAGAAEMAERVNRRLAAWVQMPEPDLRKELFGIGADHLDPDVLHRARALFTEVIDAPGGGLAIQTIHSFAQGLLASFPIEAGVAPGFQPLEDEARAALLRQAVSDQLADYAATGRRDRLEQVAAMTLRLREAGTFDFLARCARALGPGNRLPPEPGPFVRAALGLPEGPVDAWAEAVLTAEVSDDDLAAMADAAREWGKKTGLGYADAIAEFRGSVGAGRLAAVELLWRVVAKADGSLRTEWSKQLAAAEDAALRVFETLAQVRDALGAVAVADLLAGSWAVGQEVADRLARMKIDQGVADFDDLIAYAAALLRDDGLASWVRYKLDQRIDHVLVDEAQDTNARQWAIIMGIAGEFFAGEGAGAERQRTLFTVGDRKQAIFSFQGTDPAAFEAARGAFAEAARGVDRDFAGIDLATNFRSSPAVLEVVDAWIARATPAALGIEAAIGPHAAGLSDKDQRTGRVELWEALTPPDGDDDADDRADEEDEGAGAGAGGQVAMATDSASRQLADALAVTIRGWLDDGLDGRAVSAGDIMILVRSRRDFAALMVARLQAEGVPVAGVDRFALALPLAVQDLVAAARFAYQPGDDLALAGLLVSPLMGWSQERLMACAIRPSGVRLWPHLRELAKEDAALAAELEPLNELLNLVDFTTPHRFFETILSGRMQGRAKLLARLGAAARDPIEELVSQALAFEVRETPTLGGFLAWLEEGAAEIKRVTDTRQPLVRVMTVHGSKGLEAPIVILADATSAASDLKKGFDIDLATGPDDARRGLPVFSTSASERTGRLAEAHAAAQAAQLEEHWRLLYVAMTRARQLLVVTGNLGRSGKPPAETSWYHAVQATLTDMGKDWQDDAPAPFHRRLVHAHKPKDWARATSATKRQPRPVAMSLPAWAASPPAPEARPPRPLSPSQLGEDDAAATAPVPASLEAAERGRLMHALFERLPQLAPDARADAAQAWLAARADGFNQAERTAMIDQVLATLADPALAAVFAPDALAEVPLTATIGGQVIAGTVDRLVITDEGVTLVDFKTGVRVPADFAEVPDSHKRQMAAYIAALEVIAPGRPVTAALVYTAGPRVVPVPATVVAELPGP